GVTPIGYRAPSFSINDTTKWALGILAKKGFKYDSSMVRTRHPDYGVGDIPRKPFYIGKILEVPVTTWHNISAGGGYFRLFPLFITKMILNKKENAIFYIHPWEFDKNQPRTFAKKMSFFKRFRHFVNIDKTEKKFIKLLQKYKFTTMKKFIKENY
ncbi:DUF3473 domain-containing protein, partial [Candidatus Woesearchaeota archaeon]|nr:DUF3473 domain-containing protein [Candidatus Woesearchaeota archaeon]